MLIKKKIKNMFNPPKKIVGLDIGSSFIKIMEIEGENLADAVVVSYAMEPVPPDVIISTEEGDISGIEMLASIVRKCWKKSGISTKEVAICLPSSAIINKKLEVPIYETEEELKLGIETEIIKYLPSTMSLEEITLDYDIVEENKAEQLWTVIVVAAKKEKIEERVAIVQAAGLTPKILDIEQYAIQNLLSLMKGKDFEEKTYVLIDTSATMLRMFVVRKGQLIASRETEIGGINLTRSVMNEFDISYQESEFMKIKREGDEAYDIIEKTFLVNYTTELVRLLQFFTSSATNPEIDEVIIFGGVANTPNFIEFVKDALHEVKEKNIRKDPYIAKPLINIKKSNKPTMKSFHQDEASLFLVSALALRHFLRKY